MPRKRTLSNKAIALLAALLESRDRWDHGYGLSKQTGLQSGTLYPLLMRFKDQGILESEWEKSPFPGRPARQVYRLTNAGRSFAMAEINARMTRSPGTDPMAV